MTTRESDPPAASSIHDPGIALARVRADALAPGRQPTRFVTPTGAVLVGISAWTEKTLTARGAFYPDDAGTPEARLRYYASVFPLVEVDATYYAIPTAEMASRWAERTPGDFVFDVKAHALMTGHPTEPSRLPRALRDALPPALRDAKRVYPKDLPAGVLDEVWRLFRDALQPLRAAGKLGAILLQYPPWFAPTRENAAVVRDARDRLGDDAGAVEFRQDGWLSPRLAPRTEALLRDLGLAYVCVDEPQGTVRSVPPALLLTSPRLAVLRFHGRRAETWDRPGVPVVERFRWLYDRAALEEWLPRVRAAAGAAAQVHVVFNNCYGNYGTTNALEMGVLLANALT